jgi:4-hydroxy-tetrahydrodipicolinate reductase
MVNGIPGNMALQVARQAIGDDRFDLFPYSLTGPEIEGDRYDLKDLEMRLIRPHEREIFRGDIKAEPLIAVDYTHPSAVNRNGAYYCDHGLPFVMGTTGGDREALAETVLRSNIPAVIAPNMAKQIVGFQAMMEWAAGAFPDLFEGYSLRIEESHQKGKADTSGTARAMVSYFNHMGVSFSDENIKQVRDPEVQRKEWGVPEAYLDGHGWHTYTLLSPDQTVRFSFSHNVNGRDVYAKGTLDAAAYLAEKVARREMGRVFSMIDVLKGV